MFVMVTEDNLAYKANSDGLPNGWSVAHSSWNIANNLYI